MSFHQIALSPSQISQYTELKRPPQTLPVMFENERIALAVFDADKYCFNLPDAIGVQIDFFGLTPTFIFGQSGKGWSRVLEGDDDLLFIVLERPG